MLQNRPRLLPAILAVACLPLSACNRLQHGAEQAVCDNLKDPDSARFGDFYYNAKLKRACLTTNARNSMGGYTGDQQVSLQLSDKGWDWIDSSEISMDSCRKAWADNTEIPS